MTKRRRAAGEPEPAWDIALLFPPQGQWSEAEYLALNTNRLVEFSAGSLEVLPMPTAVHQLIVVYLHELLATFVTRGGLGLVLLAPFRIRLWRGKYREPDVMFMATSHAGRTSNEFWKGADLVMEVVSDDPEDRHRDLVEKRQDYARARIPEYWIVDPQEQRITVLRLAGTRYVVHGASVPGTMATSRLLRGFGVDVAAVFAQAAKAVPARQPRRPHR